MVQEVSSLSVALQGITLFMNRHFGEAVHVMMDSPVKAQERARNGNEHVLNLFFYRIAPSGFHAAAGAEDRFFIRVHALLTAFRKDSAEEPDDTDLRLLGHAMRVLASKPVIPTPDPSIEGDAGVLPGKDVDFGLPERVDYRLQAILQAPSMEELNHIWTTQGSELAYRLSAAYEFALIPIEPLALAQPAGPTRTGILEVRPSAQPDPDLISRFSSEATALPLAGPNPGDPSPVPWLPVQMFDQGGTLTSSTTIVPTATKVRIALAGPPDARTALRVTWQREGGEVVVQDLQLFDLKAVNLDKPEGRIDLNLTLPNPEAGDTAVIEALPLDDADAVIVGAPPANRLTLSVEAP